MQPLLRPLVSGRPVEFRLHFHFHFQFQLAPSFALGTLFVLPDFQFASGGHSNSHCLSLGRSALLKVACWPAALRNERRPGSRKWPPEAYARLHKQPTGELHTNWANN